MSGLNIKPAAKDEVEESTVAKADYTSHPVDNYQIGNYKFTKGLLSLEGDEVEKFDKLLASLPPIEQRRIRKLDLAAAEEFVRRRMAQELPSATQSFDSSIGERAKPVIGEGKLEDSNPAEPDEAKIVG